MKRWDLKTNQRGERTEGFAEEKLWIVLKLVLAFWGSFIKEVEPETKTKNMAFEPRQQSHY